MNGDFTVVDFGESLGIGLQDGEVMAAVITPAEPDRDLDLVLERLERAAKNELVARQLPQSDDVDERLEEESELATDGGYRCPNCGDRTLLEEPEGGYWSCSGCGSSFVGPLDDLVEQRFATDGGREAVTVDELLEVCELVEPGDDVYLSISGMDYASPLKVADVTVVRWLGGGWRTARLLLEGVRGGEHAIIGVEGEDEPRDHTSGKPFRVFRLEPNGVDVQAPADDVQDEDLVETDVDDDRDDGVEELNPLVDGERRPWSELDVNPPPNLTRTDLEAAVAKADRLYDVCQELDLRPTDRGMVRVLLVNEGLYEELDMPEGRRLATDGGENVDEWDPQPAKLREGERPDVDLDTHARRNLENIRILERELAEKEAEEEGPA